MNLFDRAREHIPPKGDAEVLFQCVVCTGQKKRSDFPTKTDGTRDEWCLQCIKYEQTPPYEEVTCEGYGQAHEEEVGK